MADTNRSTLQIEDVTQDINELINDGGATESNSVVKKRQALNDRKRGQIRRNIEEIKERRRLKELLGDDYDELDYLDS